MAASRECRLCGRETDTYRTIRVSCWLDMTERRYYHPNKVCTLRYRKGVLIWAGCENLRTLTREVAIREAS